MSEADRQPEAVSALELDSNYRAQSLALMEYAGRILQEKSGFVVVRQVEMHRPKGSGQQRLALERATALVRSSIARIGLRDRYRLDGNKTIEIMTVPLMAEEEADYITMRADLALTKQGVQFRGKPMPELLPAAEAYLDTIKADLPRQYWGPKRTLPDIIPLYSLEEQVIDLGDPKSRAVLNVDAA